MVSPSITIGSGVASRDRRSPLAPQCRGLRRVFSQDFQDQAIPGQEAKTESSHSSMDSNENWQ